jgi:PadR family transcriptional regulator PadR
VRGERDALRWWPARWNAHHLLVLAVPSRPKPLAPRLSFAYAVGKIGLAMAPTAPIGSFEALTLLAVRQLDDGAYAVPIRVALERRLGRLVVRGALYTVLSRLEAKGYLRSRMGDPSPVRGGRAKRFYTVTAAGADVLRLARDQIVEPWRRSGPLVERPR